MLLVGKLNSRLANLNLMITQVQCTLKDLLMDLNYDVIEKLSIEELAEIHLKIKNDIDALKVIQSTLVKYYDLIRKTALPELMQKQNIESLIIPNLGKLDLIDDLYASIKIDEQKNAYEWLDDNGHGGIIKQTVNAQTLKALLKSKIKLDEDIPEDFFKITKYKHVKIKGGK